MEETIHIKDLVYGICWKRSLGKLIWKLEDNINMDLSDKGVRREFSGSVRTFNGVRWY
jgi:hypothetical protein